MTTCDHVTGICVNPAHQGIGGEADRQWFAARRRQIATPAPTPSAPGDHQQQAHDLFVTARTDHDHLYAEQRIAAALAAVEQRGARRITERMERLAEEWAAEADEDERWLRGPRVGVSEAQEYPATIQQARSHVAAIRAALAEGNNDTEEMGNRG